MSESLGEPTDFPDFLTRIDSNLLRGWCPFVPKILASALEALCNESRRRRHPFTLDQVRSWAEEYHDIHSTDCLGWNDGQPIPAGLLRLRPAATVSQSREGPSVNSDFSAKDQHRFDAALAQADDVFAMAYDSMAGMAGFVLLQEEFHADYAAIRTEVAKAHAHRGAGALQVPIAHSLGWTERSELQEQVNAFLRRWRLRAIAAPYVLQIDGPLEAFPASAITSLRPEVSVTHYPAGLSVSKGALNKQGESSWKLRHRRLLTSWMSPKPQCCSISG